MPRKVRVSIIVVSLFVFLGFLMELIYRTPLDSYRLLPFALMIVESVLIVTSLFLIIFEKPWHDRLYTTRRKISSGVVAAFFFWGTVNLLAILIEPSQWNQSWTLFLHKGSAMTPWMYGIAMLLFVGPGEELMFRGYLFGTMVGKGRGRRDVLLAAFLSSVIFGVFHVFHDVHGVHSVPIGQIASAFILQVIFGLSACYWYWKTRNIVYPIVLHGLFDLPVTQALFQGFGNWLLLYYLIIPFVLVPLVRVTSIQRVSKLVSNTTSV